ncbi:MAG: exonuclease domain-containing protein [Myxococcales bacterium]|nr:exonuclease domain-containing protein [Myxococcales bacterium]
MPEARPFEHVIVLDFEATCERGAAPTPQEVIEFPSVLVSLRERAITGSFASFVRPVHHPRLSEFCRQLTSIRQEDVDAAPAFPEVLTSHQAWLAAHGLDAGNAAFVTCGDWDLVSMLPRQCAASGIAVAGLPAIYRRWINVKPVFTSKVRRSRSHGMAAMLSALKLKLEGTHHRGIDDCRNIARIVLALLELGADFERPGAFVKELPPALHPLAVELVWGDRSVSTTIERRALALVVERASALFGSRITEVVAADGVVIGGDRQLLDLADGARLLVR